jgi:hypothetical protein
MDSAITGAKLLKGLLTPVHHSAQDVQKGADQTVAMLRAITGKMGQG